jgi:hypothetical protein
MLDSDRENLQYTLLNEKKKVLHDEREFGNETKIKTFPTYIYIKKQSQYIKETNKKD